MNIYGSPPHGSLLCGVLFTYVTMEGFDLVDIGTHCKEGEKWRMEQSQRTKRRKWQISFDEGPRTLQTPGVKGMTNRPEWFVAAVAM